MNKLRMVFLCLVLALFASTAGAVTYVLDGGSLSGNLIPWAGQGHIYPLAFDVTAPGGIDVTYYDVDGAQMRFNNINWGGSLKGTGLTGVTAGTEITSIDPPNNSVWTNMLNQNTPSSADWAGHPTSTIGPDGVPLTIDDTRSWLFQSWYRPSIGDKTGQPGYGDPAYNTESYVTPNPRYPLSQAHNATFYNTYDLRIKITHDGGSNYTAERWVRMHNSAANVEGAGWAWNTDINNSPDAWRHAENEAGIFTFPMSDLDLTAARPFVEIANWETTANQGISWGSVVITGTPVLQAEVWVDDDWVGLPNGTTITLPGGGDGTIGYNAFAVIQDAVNLAAPDGIVHIEGGTYSGQIAIDKSLSLLGTGEPVIHPPVGALASYLIPESQNRYEPIIIAYGGTNDGSGNITGSETIHVTITGLNINGDNAGTANCYAAFLLRNCLASNLSYVDISNMMFSSGNPQTFGILVYGNSNITIDHNTINHFSRNGITINGDGGPSPDPIAIISNNTVVGEGEMPEGAWAQNGIQMGYGAGGSLINNEVSNVFYVGSGWCASALLIDTPSDGVILSGNNIHDAQAALYAFSANDLIVNNNNIFNNDAFVYIWAGNNTVVDGNTFTNCPQALYYADAPTAATTNNIFSDNGYALTVDGECSNLTFSGNDIVGSFGAAAFVVPYDIYSPEGLIFNGNNISGNAYGIYNTTTNMIDATGNWWGDASGPQEDMRLNAPSEINGSILARPIDQKARQHFQRNGPRKFVANKPASKNQGQNPTITGNGDAVSAYVDYSPWWGADYVGNPHSTTWNWGLNQSNASTIQEGITKASPNDLINISPGLYEEQVVINKSGLTLVGSGPADDPATNTIIKSPTSLTYFFTTGPNNFPIVGIHDIASAELRNCRIDGAGRGNSNYRFIGVGFWNAGGTLTNCYLTGVKDTPFSGSQHGVGIYSYNNTGGPYTINISGTTVDDAQKTGMALSGNGMTVNLSGCNVTGHGPTSVTAQNGIQIGFGAGGTVSNTSVSDIVYTGSNWGASAMLFYLGTSVDLVNNCAVNNSQAAIVYEETNGTVDGATVQAGGFDYEEGIDVNDYGEQLRSEFGAKSSRPASPFVEEGYQQRNLLTTNSTTVDISHVTLLGVGHAGSYGVACWSMGGVGNDINVSVTDSRIENWEDGVVSYDAGVGAAINVAAYHSSIIQNSDAGFWTNAPNIQNAANNWWGSYCGPYQATTNPGGAGNTVSDNVTYDPWCNQTFTNCTFSNNIAPATVWVDDDYTVDGTNDGHYWCYDAFDDIQTAIDAVADGGTVNVMAGTYTSQIIINKSISLIGNGNPVIQCLAGTLVAYTISESGATFEPIILAYGGSIDASRHISGTGTIQVTISGLNIDGNNSGRVNRFVGMLVRNCQASIISNNNIYEMLFGSGNPETSGILTYGNSNITIDNNTVNDFSRGGIIVNGDDSTLPDPTAIISNNTVTGEGLLPFGNWAQNGIQIGYGATGSITGNEISNIAIDDPNWAASALVLYYPAGAVTVSGNNVHDCQAGLNAYYADGMILNGGNIFAHDDYIFILGAANALVENNTFSDNYQGLYFSDITSSAVRQNTFSGNTYAMIVDGASANLDITKNIINTSDSIAITIQPYGGISPTAITVLNNDISGNFFGIANVTTHIVNAAGNWWGNLNGPTIEVISSRQSAPTRPPMANISESTKPLALAERMAGPANVQISAETDSPEPPQIAADGDAITTLVDYSPWWGANYVNDQHSSSWNWYLDISNSSTIQEAIGLAGTADLVNVLPANYTGAGNRDIDFGGKNVRLVSTDGPLGAIIDCAGAGRAFHFHSGESNNALVNGFTIKNGYTSSNGGAILCENSSAPSITGCLIINNHATGYGGAIYSDNSNPILTKSTIIWNYAGLMGGALGINNCSPAVLNSIFWQDVNGSGQEIYLNGGSPSIIYDDIEGGWQGEGNLNCDPRFCQPDSSDFSVSDLSCCVNSGMGNVTIGAFELGCFGDFLSGDVNNDGEVNAVDVTYFVRYLKDIGPPIPPPIWRGDANGNCNVNAVDVMYLVNYLKGRGPAPLKGNCEGDGGGISATPESKNISESGK